MTLDKDKNDNVEAQDGINTEETNTKETEPPKKVPKQDQKLLMLKEAFGILKSASTSASSSNETNEIKSFFSFVENKMKKYSEHTKNIVQQAICEVIFKADNGYYDRNYFPYECNAQSTYAATMPQSNRSIPMPQSSHLIPMPQSIHGISETHTTPKSQNTFVTPSVSSSPEMPVSPYQSTQPILSPSQHSSCSDSNDFDVHEYI